jgi:hypothetical protein
MRAALLLALCALPAAAQQRAFDAVPVSAVLAVSQARPDFNKALRKSVDRLPDMLQNCALGLRQAYVAEGSSVKAEADRVALGLFAHPEALLYHRDEFQEELGADRVRALEFAIEAYHTVAAKNPAVMSQLVQLRAAIDLTDSQTVEELLVDLSRAFDKNDARSAKGRAVKGKKAGQALRQALAPVAASRRTPRVEPPEPAIYTDHMLTKFLPDEDTATLGVISDRLKPYKPTALLHLDVDEDEMSAYDRPTIVESVQPGPHGLH